ncbi:uncharacterized protein [Leptinotarsa decemlineata]|uniref:uncharacterized protein n=1 Tax=Leptinotarsa decemlineata TaxID=7539 RepID=UPI003D30AB40
MPGYYRVFHGCSARTGEGTSIFRFPQDCEKAKVWLEACSRQDLLPKIDSLHKKYRICEHHFESRYISKGIVKNTLLPEAVPTIFPPILKTGKDQSQVPDRKVIILPDITIVPASKCSFVKNANDEMPSFSLSVDGPSTSREVGLQNVSTCSVNVECEERISPPLLSPSTFTQTELKLSSNTPRKRRWRSKLKI